MSIAVPILPRKTGSRLALVGTVVGVVLLTIAFVAGIRTGPDHQVRAPITLGPLFATTQPSQAAVYFITREERRYHQRRRRVDYSNFRLHAYDPATARALAEPVLLSGVDHTPSDSPRLLGFTGDVLWVWNDAVEGYSLRNLRPVWPRKKLRELNPDLIERLPAEPRHCKVLPPLNALVVRGTDSRFYRIDHSSGRIESIDPATIAGLSSWKNVEEGFHYTYPAGRSVQVLSESSYLWNSVLHEDVWYGLLTPEEASSLDGNSFGGKAATGAAPRSLYAAPFTTSRSGDRVLDVGALRRVGDARFPHAGFLRRPHSDPDVPEVFRQGPHALVLHKSPAGQSGMPQLTRLHLPGGVTGWSKPVGLVEFTELADAGASVVFAGDALPSSVSGKRRSFLVFIDIATGETRSLDVSSVAPAP